MKRAFSAFRRVLPHVTLILSLMLLTFFIIDLFNEYMAFLNNYITKALLATDAVLTAILSVCVVAERAEKKTNGLPTEGGQGDSHET